MRAIDYDHHHHENGPFQGHNIYPKSLVCVCEPHTTTHSINDKRKKKYIYIYKLTIPLLSSTFTYKPINNYIQCKNYHEYET